MRGVLAGTRRVASLIGAWAARVGRERTACDRCRGRHHRATAPPTRSGRRQALDRPSMRPNVGRTPEFWPEYDRNDRDLGRKSPARIAAALLVASCHTFAISGIPFRGSFTTVVVAGVLLRHPAHRDDRS